MPEAIGKLDSALLLFVQEHLRTPFLTRLMTFFSFLGNGGMIWILTGLALLLFRRTRKGGITELAGLLTEYLLCDMTVKKLVLRPRPYLTLPWLELLVPMEASTSFPSGHSASSFVCAYLLTRAFGKKGAWAYLLASLIALSRIYVGVHYPSDVLCGILLGTAVGVVVWPLSQWIFSAREKRRKEKRQ